MELSVVIPTMNKVGLLERTLAALRRQDAEVPGGWEVVVVDDGSTDGTARFLAGQENWGIPALQVVSPPRNVGRARARNLGARSARGRWILFLDDDIVAPPGLVAAHLAVLRTGERIGTIGHVHTAPEVVDGPHFHYLDTRGVAKLAAGEAPARYFVTQNAAVPRDAFLDVGGFDEEFSAYGFEDMEVAFRLEDRGGVRFRVLARPVPVHVHHHTSAEYFAKKVECGRHSLPHLARLHPHRIGEMRLHLVVDTQPPISPGAIGRLVRFLAPTPLARDLPRLLDGWPRNGAHRPLLAPLYCRLMDLAVLLAFRRGILESGRSI
ncbi:glycosyltransferase [bacterium]|nr:glycosyltransferase [bacterium]